MSGTMKIIVREMCIDDYENVYTLWMTIKGFGIRTVDDSREAVERFLRRNPSTSVVAEHHGQIVGSILCGHDGRRGCFYHVCVSEKYRKHGVGNKMVRFAQEALVREGISKVNLVAFRHNQVGNDFWNGLSFTERVDLNYYDYTLNEKNQTIFL